MEPDKDRYGVWVVAFLTPRWGLFFSREASHGLRPFGKLRAGCGLQSCAALRQYQGRRSRLALETGACPAEQSKMPCSPYSIGESVGPMIHLYLLCPCLCL